MIVIKPYGSLCCFSSGKAYMGFYLQEAPLRRKKLHLVGPLRQCCQQFVVYHTSPYPQRCFMAHRRAVDLWSIHRCLCSRAGKPELVCRICRQRSPSAIQRFLDRPWLLTQDCDSAAVLTLRQWGCVATTPMACRGVSEDMCFSGVADEGALDGCHEVGKIGPCDRSDGRRTCSREFSVSLFPFYSFINLVTLESLLLYRFRFSAAEY